MNVLDNSRCIVGKVFLPLPLEGSHISLLENGSLNGSLSHTKHVRWQWELAQRCLDVTVTSFILLEEEEEGKGEVC